MTTERVNAGGKFDILDGPCCDDLECPSRECWPYPGETQEQFLARLRAKYNWPAMAQEAITS